MLRIFIFILMVFVFILFLCCHCIILVIVVSKKVLEYIFIIAYWNTFIMTASKSLLDNINLMVILVLTFIDCLYSFMLMMSWWLVWQVISYWTLGILTIMSWDSQLYLKCSWWASFDTVPEGDGVPIGKKDRAAERRGRRKDERCEGLFFLLSRGGCPSSPTEPLLIPLWLWAIRVPR